MVSGKKDDFLTLTQKNGKHCDGSAWTRKSSNQHFKTLQMELFLFSQGEVLKLDTSTYNHVTRASSTNPELVLRLLGGDPGSTSALCKFKYLHCFTKIPQGDTGRGGNTEK